MRRIPLAAALLCAATVAVPAQAQERFVVSLSVPEAGAPDAPDIQYAGASRDGRVVVFTTQEALVPADTDEDSDVYARRGGRLTLESVPAEGASGTGPANFRAISADGSTIVFESDGVFAPDDAMDGADLYLRRDGQTRVVTKPDPSKPFVLPGNVMFLRVSDDGSHIVFDTSAGYATADTDFSGTDVYDYSAGQLSLASPGGGMFGGDVGLRDISADGTRIFMETEAGLIAGDTDGQGDVYQRVGGQTVLMTPDSAQGTGLAGISRDGTRAYFQTREALLPADADSDSQDVYGRGQTGPYFLVSTGPLAAGEPVDASFQKADDTGAHVAFTTFERLTADDLDNGDATMAAEDIYLRVNEATTELGSTAAVEDRTRFDAPYLFSDLSRTGGRLYWYGNQVLADDQEPFQDAFVRENGVTTRISVGETEDQGFWDASFAGASDDGSRVVFQVDGPFTEEDDDDTDDLYIRANGRTVLVTPDAPEPCTLPSYQCIPTYAGISSDGARVRFTSYDRLDPADDDLAADLYESRLAAPADLASDLAPLQVDEQAAAAPVFSDLTIAEPYDDVFGARIEVTAGAGAGDTLGFTDTGAIKGTVSGDGRTLTLSGRATDAEYQAALRTVTYRNGDDDPQAAPRTVAVTIDNGADSEVETRQVDVRPVNDAPRLAAGGSVAYAENGAARRLAPALDLSDPDSTRAAGATVAIAGGFVAGEDVLELPATPGITSAYDAATGVLTLTGDATVAEYRAALREVRYRNTSDDPSDAPRTIEYTATDGADGAAPVTSAVEVLTVDDPPRVSLAAGSLEVAATPVALDPDATLADADSATLARVVVRIAGGRAAGDALAGGTLGPITATPGDGSLTLTGNGTVGDYQAALRAVTVALTAAGTRVIEVVAEDASGASAPAQRAALVRETPAIATPTPTASPDPVTPPGAAFTRIVAPRDYEVRDGRVRIGCEVVGRTADRCRVILLRNGRVIGTGKADGEPADVIEVPVRLNRAGRRLMRRPGELRVGIDARARAADGTPTIGRTFRGVLR